jgi:predicted HicB family RNase H-like nuclease
MSNTIKYKGYHGSIDYSPADDCLHGRVLNITDVVSYEGGSVKEIKAAFKDAVDDYIAHCKDIGKKPDKPYSGKVMFRINPDIHARAALAAQLQGKSLNQWAEEVLEEATHEVSR